MHDFIPSVMTGLIIHFQKQSTLKEETGLASHNLKQAKFSVREYHAVSLVPRPSAASFLFTYVTFEPLPDKLPAYI